MSSISSCHSPSNFFRTVSHATGSWRDGTCFPTRAANLSSANWQLCGAAATFRAASWIVFWGVTFCENDMWYIRIYMIVIYCDTLRHIAVIIMPEAIWLLIYIYISFHIYIICWYYHLMMHSKHLWALFVVGSSVDVKLANIVVLLPFPNCCLMQILQILGKFL